MKRFVKFLFFVNFLFAKSALVYYGNSFSYCCLSDKTYIIVHPDIVDIHSKNFKKYRDNIYAYVSIVEADKYEKVKKSWIKAENKMWGSKVLDISNKEYQKYLLEKIEKLRKKGFKNFFFDTLDSYHLYAKKPQEIKKAQDAIVEFIHKVHKKYPDSKIVVNRGFDIIDRIHNDIVAVLFESYYRGLGDAKHPYKKVSESDRKWLDIQIKKIKRYKKDIIVVDYLPLEKLYSKAGTILFKKLKNKGFIPYISTRDLNIYGKSSNEFSFDF